jgi:hypothetical protein
MWPVKEALLGSKYFVFAGKIENAVAPMVSGWSFSRQ